MTTYTATLTTPTKSDKGTWIKSTHKDVDGHICEVLTLVELIEDYGFDNVKAHSNGTVTFTD